MMFEGLFGFLFALILMHIFANLMLKNPVLKSFLQLRRCLGFKISESVGFWGHEQVFSTFRSWIWSECWAFWSTGIVCTSGELQYRVSPVRGSFKSTAAAHGTSTTSTYPYSAHGSSLGITCKCFRISYLWCYTNGTIQSHPYDAYGHVHACSTICLFWTCHDIYASPRSFSAVYFSGVISIQKFHHISFYILQTAIRACRWLDLKGCFSCGSLWYACC